MFLRNVGRYKKHTALHLRRRHSSNIVPGKKMPDMTLSLLERIFQNGYGLLCNAACNNATYGRSTECWAED
jgi:hypothetical protein